MDIDQLRIFLEIVRLGSFSKAAESCFRSQPAVSAQIRQLEEEVGARLFDRLSSRVALTAAGKKFDGYARQILDLRKQAIAEIAGLGATPSGELAIGASEATILYILPKVFAEFKRLYPQVQVSISRIVGSAVVQRIFENQLDFGVVQLPVEERRLVRAVIHSDEVSLLAPYGHPLARLEPVGPEDLLPYPVLLPKTGRTRALLDGFLEPVRERLHISMELESSETIKRFVMAGIGVSFLATAYARAEVQSKSLCSVPLRGGMPMHLGLIYRRDKALSRAALAFIEVATKGTQ